MPEFSDPVTLIGLVEQYSPSGEEQCAVQWLEKRMQQLGFTQSFIDGAGNAVGVMGKGPRQLVLLGHIDTVPGRLPVLFKEGALYGRGVVDAKGSLACFVDAVATIGVLEDWQLIVIGAVEEERSSIGARYIVKHYQPEALIVGEPNHWDRVALGYKGTAWAEITLMRPQNHTASAEQTASELAFGIWKNIQDHTSLYNAGKLKRFDHLLPTLRSINSGQNHFDQWVRMEVGVRLPPSVTPEQWYTQLKILSDEAEVTQTGFAIPAYTCEKNTKLVRSFLAAIRAQNGTPSFVFKTGTADLNVVAPVWQCPALVYGPGDSSLDHTADEKVNLEEYNQAIKVLVQAIQAFCLV